MSKKKILTLAMALSMVAILAIGGTIAYFTDDEKITNTMVVGNIDINLEELAQQEDGTYLPFEDDQFMLFPVESADGNTGNKIVITMNESPSQAPAYIRTIVLFEKNDLLTEEYINEGNCCVPGLHYSYVNDSGSSYLGNGIIDHGVQVSQLADTITIDGQEYWVAVMEHHDKQAIPYGEGLFALKSVWMDKNITSEQIAGWADVEGEEEIKVDIIAFSQGIQAQDLSYEEAMAALGEVTTDYVEELLEGRADDAIINDWN